MKNEFKSLKDNIQLTKGKIDALLSFFIYGVGLISILLADLYVANNFDINQTANWVFTKSVIILIGTISMLGYDQVFVKDVTLIKRVKKTFFIQTLIIASISSFIIFLIKDFDVIQSIMLFVAIILMAILNYFAAASRANFKLWKSQFSTNFWKVGLLIILSSSVFEDAIEIFLLVIGLSVLMSFFLKGFDVAFDRKQLLDDKTARNIGMSFVLTNMTLIFAVYGEQFLINLFGSAQVSAHLFLYFSVFTPIALSLNGFLGFYLGPKMRKQNSFTLFNYKKMLFWITVYSIGITFISIIIGIAYMRFIQDISFSELNQLLIVSLSLMCIVRGIYISTSVCLGVFGTEVYLRKMAQKTWVITVMYIVIIVMILFFIRDLKAVIFISFASTLNWLCRLLISHNYSLITLKLKHNLNG